MDSKKSKFLIVRLGAIGDIMHCLPVCDFLKKSYPDCEIHWVVDRKNVLLLRNNPLVDKIFDVDLTAWKASWLSANTFYDIMKLSKDLRAEKYDYAFDLHGMFKSLVVTAFCGAKKRVGYKDYREFATLGANVLVKPKSKRPHTYYHIMQRNLDLVRYSGLEGLCEYEKPIIKLPPASAATCEHVDNLLSGINPNKKTIVFAPKTTWSTKHWSKNEWRALYESLKLDFNIVFTGASADLELIKYITQDDIHSFVLAGKTNLEEYIQVIREADMVISPDSSAAHIAYGAYCENGRTKIITIFTSTSKHTYAPPESCPFPLEEQKCIPCHKRRCKFGTAECTRAIKAEEVSKKVYELLINN